MVWFLTEIRKSSGYQLWVCQVGVLLEEVLSPSLLFTLPCESRQMKGMHTDSCEKISAEEDLCHNYWDLASKSNNLEADLTTLRQAGLFLFFSQYLAYFLEN